MKLSQLLEPEGVLLNVEAQDKWAALAQIVDHLSSSGLLPEAHKDDIRSRLEERERSMSTGMATQSAAIRKIPGTIRATRPSPPAIETA